MHGNGTRTVSGSGTGAIGSNGSWFLSLSQAIANNSTWYCTFHFVPVLIPVPFSCSVNIPLGCNAFDVYPFYVCISLVTYPALPVVHWRCCLSKQDQMGSSLWKITDHDLFLHKSNAISYIVEHYNPVVRFKRFETIARHISIPALSRTLLDRCKDPFTPVIYEVWTNAGPYRRVMGCTVLRGCIHTHYLVNFCIDWKVQ